MSARLLLNANQQRRLGTGLRMLRHDLAAVASWPEVARAGEPQQAIRDLVSRLVPAVESLEASLGLPAEWPVPPGRRVGAIAAVWANRLEDLHAKGLRPYGKVHPDLAGVLDAKLDGLIGLLEELADAAARLPPR
jgi:hypothetical protein